MPIYNRERSYSETGTSIDQGIMVSQKGIITFVPAAGTVLAIPTNIARPIHLSIMPMATDTADVLGGSSGATVRRAWYSDLTLHYATGASAAFGSIGSNVALAEVGRRIRMSGATDGYKLYVAMASQSSNYGASKHSRLASTAYWRQLTEFGANQQKYLIVNVNNAASIHYKVKKQTISYEVTGYEY